MGGDLIQRIGHKLYEQDRASQALGMRLIEMRSGFAVMAMTVRDDMINGHGTCHGGLIFTLADSAFAFACNSENLVTVALNCQISFLRPAKRGDMLTATAERIHHPGRTGLYDIKIINQCHEPVAMFRGTAHRTKVPIIDAGSDQQ